MQLLFLGVVFECLCNSSKEIEIIKHLQVAIDYFSKDPDLIIAPNKKTY